MNSTDILLLKTEHRRILKKANSESQKIVIFYNILLSYVFINFAMIPLIIMLYKRLTGVPTSLVPLPLKVYYGFELTHPYYDMMYAWISFAIILMMFIISSTDCIFVSISVNLRAQLTVLRKDIEKIGYSKYCESLIFKCNKCGYKFTSKYTCECLAVKKLKLCIVRHNDIIQLTKEVEKLFNHQTIVHFLLISLCICSLLFHVSLNIYNFKRLMVFLGYLCGTLFQLFMFAKYGQEVLDESLKIADALYDCPWYYFGNKFRKMLIIMMIIAQKPLGFTAAKFYYVSIKTFSVVLKISASYFTLLQTVNNKNV